MRTLFVFNHPAPYKVSVFNELAKLTKIRVIFERIKEELRAGKAIEAAIESGFNKAWSAIFDANLTTAITSFVLWEFGTGAIKGFAITLLIGICSSMFTAIFVARVVFNYFLKAHIKMFSHVK